MAITTKSINLKRMSVKKKKKDDDDKKKRGRKSKIGYAKQPSARQYKARKK